MENNDDIMKPDNILAVMYNNIIFVSYFALFGRYMESRLQSRKDKNLPDKSGDQHLWHFVNYPRGNCEN
jgi:hypothetical protein